MSKSLAERPPVYRGPSKIPKFTPVRQPLPDIEMDNDGMGGRKPSKLMQLRSDYQSRIMREKEEKMVRMYDENQKKALNRVNSKGMVRDFFKERREIEGSSGIPSQIPTMNQHFQRKRKEEKYGDIDLFERRKKSGDIKHGGYATRYAMGRDKSNPLAPIDRNDTTPPITRKPQIHGRPRTKEDNKPKNNVGAFAPRSAPVPNGIKKGVEIYENMTHSPIDDTPPPNLSQLKKLQKQKIKSSRSTASPASQRNKMTDFQKWQGEQDEARSERLKKHLRVQNESDEENVDEGDDDDILSRQNILMEQIQRQKDELERMRVERQREEEEERREMEKRKRREEERRRRAKEETERRRDEEEERRRHEVDEQKRLAEEDMMFQAGKRQEEEAQRRLEAESRMTTNRTNKTYRSDITQSNRKNMEDDFVKAEESYRSVPSPPKNPKPMRVKRPVFKSKPKQNYEREESPPREFKADISMYVDAAKDSDAYGSSNVKLVPCSKCGRKFAADRVQRHMDSCDNLTKKRKILDPTKIRTTGTDMENYNRNPKSRSKTPPKKKSNWRQQHENFIQNLRYAKKVSEMEKTGQDMSHLPPPPKTENPDYVKCPNCSRTFNPTTAERHIPRCKAPPRMR